MTHSLDNLRKYSAAAVFLVGLGMSQPGLAETTDCTPITVLPAILTVQGIYCLTGNLSTDMPSGYAIDIQTNNVTIDLNGWKLGGLAAGTGTQTRGIFASDRKNITIRNGTVRGFFFGIHLDGEDAQDNLIEDVRAEQNRISGIQTHGLGDVIRRNQVVDTGGSSIPYGGTYGIVVLGDGTRVLDNDIVGVTDVWEYAAYGMQIFSSAAVIEGNRIAELTGVFTVGIELRIGSSSLVSNNRFNGPINYGIQFIDSATGGYRENQVFGVITTAFSGGTNFSNNYAYPPP